MTQIRRAAAALAAVALSLSAVPAQAGIFIGVGGPYYGRPYYGYGRPYYGYGYGYYRPYGVGVIVAPPPVVIAPPPPVIYAQPTVVQPAPYAAQSAPVTTVPVTTSSAPTTVPVTTAPPPGETVAAPGLASDYQAAINQQLQHLSSADERARGEAAIELGRMRAAAAVDRLNTVLANDPSAQVRETAARALGLIGSPRSLNALRYAGQADNDRDVRRSAQFAVDIITTNMRR